MISPSGEVFALSTSARLDMVPAVADPHRILAPLPGGLTNDNFKVTAHDDVFVARLSRPSAAFLAIDRDAEHRNSVAAAGSGVAPRVIDYVPQAGVLLIEWVAGRTLQPTDLGNPDTLERVAAACRLLHSGPRFGSDFDMFDIRDRYLKTVLAGGFRLPARYLDFTAQWDRVRTVLAMNTVETVPCHNDLLAANFIDDGDKLWLIDYEYSGNNDPCFELGNIWSESNLSDEHLEVLVDSYYGEHRPQSIARTRLQGLVSQYGWTLWGVIQSSVSDLDFDFRAWAMEKYERAAATFDSPIFNDLLTAAAAVDPVPTPSTTTKEKLREHQTRTE